MGLDQYCGFSVVHRHHRSLWLEVVLFHNDLWCDFGAAKSGADVDHFPANAVVAIDGDDN